MLRETQIAFSASLLAGSAEANNDIANRIHSGRLPAVRRLEIYRHNVYANLCGVLRDIYPVILAVVGETFFMHTAAQFVKSHPSHSGDLNQFGQEWAQFLDAYPHAAELPYLSDVARLEWSWHQAFHAGDAPPFDLSRLLALPSDDHASLRFLLHPSVRLIQSHFPVFRIWEVNQPTFKDDVEVDWDDPVETLLIHRDTNDGVSVLIERIHAPGYAFLLALEKHATLEAATVAALKVDATFDLQGFLINAVQTGVIVDFGCEQP